MELDDIKTAENVAYFLRLKIEDLQIMRGNMAAMNVSSPCIVDKGDVLVYTVGIHLADEYKFMRDDISRVLEDHRDWKGHIDVRLLYQDGKDMANHNHFSLLGWSRDGYSFIDRARTYYDTDLTELQARIRTAEKYEDCLWAGPWVARIIASPPPVRKKSE